MADHDQIQVPKSPQRTPSVAGDPAPGRRFDELTDPEIAAALARSPRVMLPMGSIEQHGPHLPTGTDFFAATAIALEVAEHLDALVLPLCPLGVTPCTCPTRAPCRCGLPRSRTWSPISGRRWPRTAPGSS